MNAELTEINQHSELKPARKIGFDLTPQTFEEAERFANMVANSDLVPSDYKGKPGNCLIAMQMGSEIGIPPLQALQNISVINGRPAIWGDLLPALAQAHPKFELLDESFDDSTMTATCKVKRKNQPEQIRTFNRKDAETAGLWGRNTWKQYPKRMLQMRARGFAVRDVFPDALKGISVAEDIIDLDPKDFSTVSESSTAKVEGVPYISDDQLLQIDAFIAENKLERNLWLEYVNSNFGQADFGAIPVTYFDKFISQLNQAVTKRIASQSNK